MSHLALGLIVGCGLCLIHLAIGLAIGARISRTTIRYVALTRPSTEGNDTQRISSQWFELCLRLSEMASSANLLGLLPADLMSQWREELLRLTNELCQVLERARYAEQSHTEPRGLSAPPIETSLEKTAESDSEVITNTQLLEVLEKQQGYAANADESTPLVRYKFSTKQPLATADTSRPLEAEAFSLVQFHDLSIRDVRYFLDERPLEDNVVIGLGVPKPVKWIAAKIEDYRSVFMYGRVGYLVTARLLACIDKRTRVAASELKQSTTRCSP